MSTSAPASAPPDSNAAPNTAPNTAPNAAATIRPARSSLTLLVVLWAVWGTNWPLFPIILREVSVWNFRAVSCIGAGLVLLAVARWRGLPLSIARPLWPRICIATLFYLVLWNVASAWSAALIPSGQAAILGFTMPLWAALLGWAVLGQRLSARMLLALGLGAAAVALLGWKSLQAYAQAPLGVALGLLAALGWAVGTLILQRGQVTVPALVLTGWQLLITAVPIGAVALVELALSDAPLSLPSTRVLALIVWITLVPMAIGNLCWFMLVGRLPAAVAGLSSIMVPVVAMVSGALVHGEPLGPVQLAAMVCSAAGLWLSLKRH